MKYNENEKRIKKAGLLKFVLNNFAPETKYRELNNNIIDI